MYQYKNFLTQLLTGIETCPIIYIPHFHFNLVDEALKELIEQNPTDLPFSIEDNVCEYDCYRGIVNFSTKKKEKGLDELSNIDVLLPDIITQEQTAFVQVFLFKNFVTTINNDSRIQSVLQTFAAKYEKGDYTPTKTIIIVDPMPSSELPIAIQKITTVIEVPTPTEDEIRDYITSLVSPQTFENPRSKNDVEELVRTLQGLQMYEVKQIMRTVLELNNGHISSKSTRIALEEKKRIVKKSGIIEVIDPNVRFEEVGGLKKLKEDLEIKSKIYHNLGDAKKYGIPIPKGILIIGMPGCGKSMIAKATAEMFGVSLLRLDVSRLMGKYVGESEANLRLALATAEAAHPCVLWIDEIEKAFAGGNKGNGDDDNLVLRLMGHFLTWMQERETPVYIVATANDVMRPEFMRKGRFDEVYFVDFPDEQERAEILHKKIENRYPQIAENRLFDFSEIGNCVEVVKSMKGTYGGFSGSEIECILNMVVEKKFAEYLEQKDKPNFQKSIIKITKADFEAVIKTIQQSVMANQKGTKKEEDMKNKTSIERIKEMQEIYKFTNASSKQ